ncbi:hypothetical protein CCH79_00018073, partial [Gambusia affinis]
MWLLLTITLPIVVVLLMLHCLNIITLTHVFTSESKLSKLVITILDDPKISGTLTLTVTVFFIFSNSLTTTLLVVVSAVFSLHWLDIVPLPGFFPSAVKDPKISGAISGALTPTITVFFFMSNIVVIALSVVVFVIFSLHQFNIITLTHIFDLGLNNPKISGVLTVIFTVLLTLSNSLTATFSVAVIVTLWLDWLNIVTLTDAFRYARNLSELVISALDDPYISRVLTLSVTMLFISLNSVTTNLSVAVIVTLCLNWLDIITLTDAFTYARNLSELVISVLDDPKISSMVTLTVAVLFIFSSSLTSTLLVVVSVIFSLHWLNIVRLSGYVPSALDNPKASRAVAVTAAGFLTLLNPLIIVLAALNFVLWFDWLEISTLTELFTLGSDLFMSFISDFSDANTCTDSKSEGKELKSTGVKFEDVREGIRVKLSLAKTEIRETIRVRLGLEKLQISETVQDLYVRSSNPERSQNSLSSSLENIWRKTSLTDLLTEGKPVSDVVMPALEDPKMSGALTRTATSVFILTNSLETTLLVLVDLTLWLQWINILPLTELM